MLINRINKALFSKYIFNKDVVNVSQWKNKLEHFTTPKDEIDRAYLRYLCRMEMFPFWYRLLVNFMSIPFVVSEQVKYTFSKTQKSLYPHTSMQKQKKAVLLKKEYLDYTDVIPDALLCEFQELTVVPDEADTPQSEVGNQIAYLMKECVKRRPLSFYLNYTILRDLKRYAMLINKHKPDAFIVYVEERMFSGPVIKKYCEDHNVEFISFMHGDYALQIIQGFMDFTRYYVWDEYYKQMFTRYLHCDSKQFIVYRPLKCKGICKPRVSDEDYNYYMTYYFAAERKEQIIAVHEIMVDLLHKGYNCKVRPHPRHSDVETIKNVFVEFTIEDCQKVSLADSMECSRFIVALASTVLSEAYYSGKEIVVDDCTDVNMYKQKIQQEYFIYSKPHLLLSKLLDGDMQHYVSGGSN